MIGRTIGHYEVIEKIGEGGMGAVYKARDIHLDRSLALKMLPGRSVANSERRRRFALEAKAASALNHPNIITIYDIDVADGTSLIGDVPRGYFLWKVVKPGFAETTGAAPTWWSVVSLRLVPAGEVPDGMVLVPGAESLGGTIGITTVDGPRDSYFIDRHEVTNRQFKQFVDRGGT